jgi:hypothetical protein
LGISSYGKLSINDEKNPDTTAVQIIPVELGGTYNDPTGFQLAVPEPYFFCAKLRGKRP